METPQHGPTPGRVIDSLGDITRLDALDAYQGRVLDTIRSGLGDGVDALEVSGDVADANDALTRRLLELAETASRSARRFRYRWLALGSHGRREQVLSSDQDSAIAYDGRAPGQEPLPRLLRAAGRPGGRRRWRGRGSRCAPAATWPRTGAVRSTSSRSCSAAGSSAGARRAAPGRGLPRRPPCHGDLPIDVLDRILLAGGARGPFRAQLAQRRGDVPPAARPVRPAADAQAAVDVKRAGPPRSCCWPGCTHWPPGPPSTAPCRGCRPPPPPAPLSRIGRGDLIEAYRFLTDLRLRHQLEQVRRGQPADNRSARPADRASRRGSCGPCCASCATSRTSPRCASPPHGDVRRSGVSERAVAGRPAHRGGGARAAAVQLPVPRRVRRRHARARRAAAVGLPVRRVGAVIALVAWVARS